MGGSCPSFAGTAYLCRLIQSKHSASIMVAATSCLRCGHTLVLMLFISAASAQDSPFGVVGSPAPSPEPSPEPSGLDHGGHDHGGDDQQSSTAQECTMYAAYLHDTSDCSGVAIRTQSFYMATSQIGTGIPPPGLCMPNEDPNYPSTYFTFSRQDQYMTTCVPFTMLKYANTECSGEPLFENGNQWMRASLDGTPGCTRFTDPDAGSHSIAGESCNGVGQDSIYANTFHEGSSDCTAPASAQLQHSNPYGQCVWGPGGQYVKFYCGGLPQQSGQNQQGSNGLPTCTDFLHISPDGNECDGHACTCADVLRDWPKGQLVGQNYCESSTTDRISRLWSGGWQQVDSTYGKAMIRPCIDCNSLTDAPERFNLNGALATAAYDHGMTTSPGMNEDCSFVISTLHAAETQSSYSYEDTSGLTQSHICSHWDVDQIASEVPFTWNNPPSGKFASVCPKYCYNLDPGNMQHVVECVVYDNNDQHSDRHSNDDHHSNDGHHASIGQGYGGASYGGEGSGEGSADPAPPPGEYASGSGELSTDSGGASYGGEGSGEGSADPAPPSGEYASGSGELAPGSGEYASGSGELSTDSGEALSALYRWWRAFSAWMNSATTEYASGSGEISSDSGEALSALYRWWRAFSAGMNSATMEYASGSSELAPGSGEYASGSGELVCGSGE